MSQLSTTSVAKGATAEVVENIPVGLVLAVCDCADVLLALLFGLHFILKSILSSWHHYNTTISFMKIPSLVGQVIEHSLINFISFIFMINNFSLDEHHWSSETFFTYHIPLRKDNIKWNWIQRKYPLGKNETWYQKSCTKSDRKRMNKKKKTEKDTPGKDKENKIIHMV